MLTSIVCVIFGKNNKFCSVASLLPNSQVNNQTNSGNFKCKILIYLSLLKIKIKLSDPIKSSGLGSSLENFDFTCSVQVQRIITIKYLFKDSVRVWFDIIFLTHDIKLEIAFDLGKSCKIMA